MFCPSLEYQLFLEGIAPGDIEKEGNYFIFSENETEQKEVELELI